MNSSTTNWIVVLFAVAIVAVAAWWYQRTRTEPAVAPATPIEAVPEMPERPGPLHPLAPLPRDDTERELVDLPALDDSDGYFALALADLLGSDIDAMLVDSGLIEKFVTTIDNLPRSQVAERVRPLTPLAGAFQVDELDRDTYRIHPDNYKRYVPLVDMLIAADADAVAETYRRFYPLLQQAYVSLGYPDGYFNDRVVEVIDHLLDAPEPAGPIHLVRPHVLYEYADPELEALSSGQKLMLRIGPDNAARVKSRLRELRDRIA
jgi:hypothetical protein